MRLQHAFVASLVALSCAQHLGPRGGLRARQDNTEVSATSDNTPTSATASDAKSGSSTAPTITDSASTTDSNNGGQGATNTQDGAATVPITVTNSALGDVPTSMPNSTVLPGNSTSTDHRLPIQPKINPPLGVGGVILIISGLGLGFVGIKHRATQTFLSTSLLVGLGCEVLVVYLMHPPVPVAIQGAYLIAGVVGGFLFGGLALIFKEMSEGFGCLLGGFCLAMWLLVLSPGGLITNKVGKIILIGMLCAGCYCLYISRFTRVYGMIFCTAFAGSTAFVLGIDCFSKAGLKEFWLYIWDLNDNEFPLFTETYPITRNMRVEIASIVIVAFLGTMSQIKIWKIVKEQRAKRDAQRIADEEARDVEEAEVGRDVEDRTRQSLAHWEGNYDGKKGAFVEVDSKGISLEDLTSDGTASRRHTASKRQSLHTCQSTSSLNLLGSNHGRASAAPSLPRLSFGFGENGGSTREVAPSTVVTTPGTEPSTPGLSVAATSVKDRRGASVKRLSLMSLKAMEAREAPEDENPFVVEQEEDLASSVAATAAEVPDMDALSVRLSRPNSMFRSYAAGTSPLQTQEQWIEDEDEEALYAGGAGGASSGLSQVPGNPAGSGKEGEAENESGEAGEKTALEEKLPKRISKAAASYRVNEWAKEVSRAEPEPIEETLEHDSDAVRIEMGNAAEFARAEENNAAPAPPPPPSPPPPPPQPKTKPAKVRSSTNLTRATSSTALTPVSAHEDTQSNDSWSVPLARRASSNPKLSVTPVSPAASLHATRNFSTPMLDQTVVESPVQVERSNSRPSSTMPKQVNLLDERRDRLEKRLTTTSFMTPPPAAVTASSTTEVGGSLQGQSSGEGSQGDDTELPSLPKTDDEEDMTLAERKALVQQQAALLAQNAENASRPLNSRHVSQVDLQTQPQRHVSMNAKAPKAVRLSTGGAQKPIYDSHQPRRASSHDVRKQAVNWTQWRSSTAIASTSRSPYAIGDSQMDMLRAVRVQTESEAKLREQQKQVIQEQIDAHMRMGGMNDAHRKAMAKMQGKANKNVQ